MNTEFVSLIQNLDKHFKSLEIDFFIIGAKARDLICEQAGVPLSARATSDVDFGVLVDSWATLEKLREHFRNDPNIRLHSEKNKVRHYYNGTPFDVVPFGGIEHDHKISWPPFYDCIMTVIGYGEALTMARSIQIGHSTVKVVTPEMLIALKIVSWHEAPERNKDAKDIAYVLERYQSIDPTTYTYILDHHAELLAHFDYDDVLASIALVGIRIVESSSPELHALIAQILNRKDEKLARAMVTLPSSNIESDETKFIEIVNALKYGIIKLID